jgi:hypothetical protein
MIGAPLLLALLLIGAATLATQRSPAVPLVAGLALTAVATLYTLDLSRYAADLIAWDHEPKGIAVINGAGLFYGANVVGGYHPAELLPALLALAQVAGVLLVAVGAVRGGATQRNGSAQRAPGGPGGDLGT